MPSSTKLVSIPKRVLEALKPVSSKVCKNLADVVVSIPKRVLEALKLD